MKYKERPFWLYVSYEDHYIDTDIRVEEEFSQWWFTIETSGRIWIRGSWKPKGHKEASGFAWDGCTPKFVFLDLLWGIPDGVPGEDGTPKTYYASMFHDAMYQFGRKAGISKRQADRIFLRLLREQKFKLAYPYYLAVKVLGRMC